jgi:hypothetical protein
LNGAAPQTPPPAKKAGWRQVAATMFWALCMIGKKGTWERDGVTLTMGQVLIGAAIMTLIVIGLLVLLVRMATA